MAISPTRVATAPRSVSELQLLDRHVLAHALHELDDGIGNLIDDIDVPLFDFCTC